MSRTTRRTLSASILGLATAAGVLVGGSPATAAPNTGSAGLIPPNTVLSPPSLLNAPYVDILAASVDYDPRQGRLSATVFLRGAPARSEFGGPAYALSVFGPGPNIGGGSVISASAAGVPARTSLTVRRTATGPDQSVPARISHRGATVVFSAFDDRLRDLPLRSFGVTATRAGNGTVTSPLGVDSVSGRLG